MPTLITNTQTKTTLKREVVVDILRGFAVMTMIITHVIAISYAGGAGKDQTVANLGLFGGVFSFTAFLFLSGISTYYSNLVRSEEDFNRGKNINRVIKILVVYYLLATASIFVNTTLYSLPPTVAWGSNLLYTMFFLIVPQFAEFLIPFALLALSAIFFRKFYRLLINNPLIGLVAIAIFYLLGSVLLNINLGSTELNTVKGIFSGHIFEVGQLHTFPILQYFPVFLLGTYFAKFLAFNQNLSKRIKVIIMWLIAFGGLTVAGVIAFRYLPFSILNPLPDEGRFPPSLTFLALSLFSTLALFLLLFVLYKIIPKFVKIILHYFGVNALEMLFFHSILLFIYKYITTSPANPSGIKHIYLNDVIIITILVLLASAILISLKNSLKRWSLSESEEPIGFWILTEKAISTFIFIIIFIIVGTTVYKDTIVKTAIADTTNIQFKKRLIREEDPWWNHEFRVYRPITIENKSSPLPLYTGSWVSFRFNHEQALGSKSASRESGGDIRVVYFDEEVGEYKDLPIIFNNPKAADSQIAFKLEGNINPGEISTNYYLYYGNDFTDEYNAAKDKYNNPPFEEGLKLGDEVAHSIKASANKKWFLKKKATAFQAAALVFDVTLLDSEIASGSIVTYSITGTPKNGRMRNISDRNYQAAVVVSDLEPGRYYIQANVTDSKNNLKIFRSQKVSFNLSYPIYVTWTMDWEGWDVGQNNLNDIADIANSYGMPITHFFNPRIYVKNQYTMEKISEDRARFITNWVKDRQQNKFDEIGMHIHMWADMVSEAGVRPRTDTIIGTYGTDVPSNVYTREELEKVFNWGRSKFSEFGLGSPTSYRTGAWMSGTNVLLAAQTVGFSIDSSGRTGGRLNPSISNSTVVPWTLNETTKPYLPNLGDINSWAGNLNERMKIWEFPNNGADSYWFGTGELIRRFDANFPDKNAIVTSPQVVTYLSHPHWFVAVDTGKVRNLFNHTNQYLFRDDKGPVVYSTLETIYSEWDRDKFINGN